MSRVRMMLFSTSAAFAMMLLATLTQAQGPGGRGGPGGPGGFGGPGGPGGMWGGRGGSSLRLLQNAAVQEDLKLTDEQKAQIKKADEASTKKRDALTAAMPKGARGGRGGRGGAGAGGQPGGQDPGAQGGGQAVDPQADPAPPFDFAAFRSSMQALQSATDAAVGKILTKNQKERLAQIELQRAGPMAVLRPEIAQKLNISDDQMEEMQAIQAQSREATGQMWAAGREAMQNFRTPDGGFDRAAMQAFRDSPEGKAQAAAMQKQTEVLQKQTISEVGQVLTKKQKQAFNKMLGKPFDLTKLDGPGGPGGPGGPPPANGAAASDTATGKTKASAATTGKANRKASSKKKAANP